MSNRWVEAVLKAILHVAVFFAVYWGVKSLAGHSPAREAYGWLSGWWAALYVGYLASIGLLSALLIVLGYVALGILAVYGQWHWFGELPARLDLGFVVFPIFTGGIVYASPAVINVVVRAMIRRLHRSRASPISQ